MSNTFSEIIANQKVGAMTAGSTIATWLASMWGWIDAHMTMVEISSFTSFIFLLLMIVTTFAKNQREARLHGADLRERELRIELLKKQLEEKDSDA